MKLDGLKGVEIKGTMRVKNIAVSFFFFFFFFLLLKIERITASLYRNMDATAATQVTFVWLKAIPVISYVSSFKKFFL